mgnify:CR=1 FL=1
MDHFLRAGYNENSQLSFTNLYMWQNLYPVQIAVEDDVMFLTKSVDGDFFALQPIGSKEKMIWAVDKFMEYFQDLGKPLQFFLVDEKFAELLANYPGAEFKLQANRDRFDYVYRSEDLICLAGRKYHSKKNHWNSFWRNFPQARYVPISEENISLCKLELDKWYLRYRQEKPEDSVIEWERDAALEVLNDFSFFEVRGGAILLDGRIVAFTFGEQINKDMAVIHVEKADPTVRGAYPAINQGFVEHEWAHLSYINREEDLGVEGLRKAKESYKPVKMIRKYNAVLKQ